VTKVESMLAEILRRMGLEIETRVRAEGGGTVVELAGPDRGLLTRREAELLGALQLVLNRMSRRAFPGAGRIDLLCNGHRTRRDDDVVELVRELAERVARTGQPKRLHPMNAYERRLVHLTVRKYPGLGSRSEGEGPLKQVRIFRQR
jgi:spoIIIJ-associated protein